MSKDPGHGDRELGMHRAITRRDFLNGIAVGAGSMLGSAWLPGWTLAAETAHFSQDVPGYNPAALTGLRGSHPGAFEVAHAVRDGTFWETAGKAVDPHETYDLIVVGAGLSGLAAAYFYRKQAGASARILILDNHDDFGGHAKRNEFRPGRTVAPRQWRNGCHRVSFSLQSGSARVAHGTRH